MDLALDGKITGGFCCLSGGLARAAEAAADGEAWGPELVQGYRETLDRYTKRYGER